MRSPISSITIGGPLTPVGGHCMKVVWPCGDESSAVSSIVSFFRHVYFKYNLHGEVHQQALIKPKHAVWGGRRHDAHRGKSRRSLMKVALIGGALALTDAFNVAPASVGGRTLSRSSTVRMEPTDTEVDFGLELGQKFGPTSPAHPAVPPLPWTNTETQEDVQLVKAASNGLRAPLLSDMQNDEIFVSKDSVSSVGVQFGQACAGRSMRAARRALDQDLTHPPGTGSRLRAHAPHPHGFSSCTCAWCADSHPEAPRELHAAEP